MTEKDAILKPLFNNQNSSMKNPTDSGVEPTPIDPKRLYTVREMHESLQCFPWLKNYRTYLSLVRDELAGSNRLNVQGIKGRSRTKYLVRGSDILAFVKTKMFT